MLSEEELSELFDKRILQDSFKIIDRACKKHPEYLSKWIMLRVLFEYAQLSKARLIKKLER